MRSPHWFQKTMAAQAFSFFSPSIRMSDGTSTFVTSTIVDDRPQLNALSIANNEIFLDAVIHGIDEPMCCPTLRTTRHYRFWTMINWI